MFGVVAAEVEIEKNRHAFRGLGQIEQNIGGRGIGRRAQPQRRLQPYGRHVAGERDISTLHGGDHGDRHGGQLPAVDEFLEQLKLVGAGCRPPFLGRGGSRTTRPCEHVGKRECPDGGLVVIRLTAAGVGHR